ncbi:MAG: glycosyltransferase family 4 protein [Chloroflexi bacterium]|nr:glycosyltransferase family 4 protein [Chloroflexota bacterium]
MLAYSGGGISRYVRNLVRALSASHSLQLGVLVARRDPNSWSSTLSTSAVSRRVVWTPCHHRLERWTLTLEVSAAQPSMLHLVDHVGVSLLPCPQVVTVHDLAFWRFPKTHTDESRRYYAGGAATLHRASAIICVSSFTRSELLHYLPLDPARVIAIPNGVDEQFTPRPDPLLLYKKFDITHPYILAVGTVEQRKHLDLLLDAFVRLHRPLLDLAIVGSDGFGAAALWNQVEQLGLSHRVHRLGRVSDGELVTLYSTAEALVFPSYYEGFAFPPLEAMACGTPVVGVREGPLLEVCGDGDESAALLVDNDPTALARAIELVLSDPELGARLQERGQRRAALFTWERTAQQTWEVYEQVLQNAR